MVHKDSKIQGFKFIIRYCTIANLRKIFNFKRFYRIEQSGVAELGGPGGPWPPQKFEWRGQGMFWPPKILTTCPPKIGASSENLCKIASQHPEMSKIFRLRRTY